MKVVLFTALLIAAVFVSGPRVGEAQTASVSANPTCTLIIHMTGFRNSIGDAGAAIFSSPEGWPEDRTKAVQHDAFPITGKTAAPTFKVPAGKYAISVLHDENSNHKLDRNFLGLPREGFGFTNNPRVFLTPPSFETASILVKCPVTETTIQLIYK